MLKLQWPSKRGEHITNPQKCIGISEQQNLWGINGYSRLFIFLVVVETPLPSSLRQGSKEPPIWDWSWRKVFFNFLLTLPFCLFLFLTENPKWNVVRIYTCLGSLYRDRCNWGREWDSKWPNSHIFFFLSPFVSKDQDHSFIHSRLLCASRLSLICNSDRLFCSSSSNKIYEEYPCFGRCQIFSTC